MLKTIGILGGMSWESTIAYYEQLNLAVRERLGQLHSAKIVLTSFDFAEIAALQAAQEWDQLREKLCTAAVDMKNAGAEAILIATNTMHCLAPDIEAKTGIPLLHIADATAKAINAQGAKTVGLLGTRFTMEGDFYRDHLKQHHDIEVLIPNEADRDTVHRIIYSELCQGRLLPESKQALCEIISGLHAAGAQGVILGCTELPLILTEPSCCGVPLYDTIALHVAMATDFLFSDSLASVAGV